MRIPSKLAAIALTTGMTVIGVVGMAGPAHAADTPATFTITAGVLAVSVPTSTVAIATVATGAATASGSLGAVTVDDGRGLLSNGWITTVSTTAFTTGTATTNENVATGSIAYSSGAFTAHSGAGTFVPGTITSAPSYTGAAGISSTTWNPTVTFTLASTQVAGLYSGTITHSVA